MLKDVSLSAIVAGFIAVLVGFTSSVAIIFQAAQGLGATPAQITSWVWALGIGMGLTSIGLSLRYRQPVLTAWSTPGAALLVASHDVGFLRSAGITRWLRLDRETGLAETGLAEIAANDRAQ